MEKLAGFLEKYEKALFTGTIILWLLTIIFFYIHKNHYEKIYEGEFVFSDALAYGIDDVSVDDAQISGWCIKPGSDISTYNIRIILWSDVLGYGYAIPAEMQMRNDITTYIDDGYDYSRSGFLCCINRRWMEKAVYRIFIQYKCNGYDEVAYTENYFVSDYQIVYQEPQLSENISCNVEYISTVDAVIQGWREEKLKGVQAIEMNVILWKEEEDYGYYFPCYRLSKEEGADGYWNVGFRCVFENCWIEDGDYKIYVQYERNGRKEICDTNQCYKYNTKVTVIHEEPKEEGELNYELEEVSSEKCLIRGRYLPSGAGTQNYITDIILWKEEKDYGYVLPVQRITCTDIAEGISNEYNHGTSEFVCRYQEGLLSDGDYKIYLRYQSNGRDHTANMKAFLKIGE